MEKYDIVPYDDGNNENNDNNDNNENNDKEEKIKKVVFKGDIKKVLIDGKFYDVCEMEVEDEADLPLGQGPNKFVFQKLFEEAYGPIDRDDIDTIPESMRCKDLFTKIEKSEDRSEDLKLLKNPDDLNDFIKTIFNKIDDLNDFIKTIFNKIDDLNDFIKTIFNKIVEYFKNLIN